MDILICVIIFSRLLIRTLNRKLNPQLGFITRSSWYSGRRHVHPKALFYLFSPSTRAIFWCWRLIPLMASTLTTAIRRNGLQYSKKLKQWQFLLYVCDKFRRKMTRVFTAETERNRVHPQLIFSSFEKFWIPPATCQTEERTVHCNIYNIVNISLS